MRRDALLDTGPLVASVNRHDQFHEWARAQLDNMTPPLLTCEAVLSEACFLLQERTGDTGKVILELVHRGIIEVRFQVKDNVAALINLMGKYSDIPMSFADACLVRMSEIYPERVLLTLDDDFLVYRRLGRQAIPVLMPVTK